MRDPNDAAKVFQRLFVNFIPTEQVGVVTEVTEEPMQFPKGSSAGVQATAKNLAGVLDWLKNRKSQDEERLVRMPAIEGLLDANEEDTLKLVIARWRNLMKPGDVALHGRTSCTWEKLLSFASRPSRSSTACLPRWLMKASTISRLAARNSSVPQNSAA